MNRRLRGRGAGWVYGRSEHYLSSARRPPVATSIEAGSCRWNATASLIGYYVHHVGRGHLHRAVTIQHETQQPVTGLSSHPRPAGWRGEWIQLPDDATSTPAGDHTAGGRLHWVPTHHGELRRRMAMISDWVDRSEPSAMVVDVSVEVALLARLHGIPVVSMGMPGERRDSAHALGYGVSELIVGPWPADAAGIWSGPVTCGSKLVAVGAISRFCGRPAESVEPYRVVVLNGEGGAGASSEQVEQARQAAPAWDWIHLDRVSGTWVDDPWPLLCSASVIVSHAGQNAIAEIAAARRPAVVIPQPRPHDEQLFTARVLGEMVGIPAVVADGWPTDASWPTLLERAARLDGAGWSRWNDGRGARRVAAILDSFDAGSSGYTGPYRSDRRRRPGVRMTTAVITVVHGRHSRLATQELMLRRSAVRPEVRVVVAVDDPDIASLVDESVRLVSVAGQPGGLPIGAARNAGAARAVDAGCDLLVFLDVDCLPSAGLVAGYQAAAAATGDDALLCGPVAYLPPPPRGGYDLDSLGDHPFHPARPVPAPGELRRDGDHRLFWSLSFAVTAACWQRLGGFCERYVGYGAEDTDLGMIADRNHVGVTWVGDAAAYHQWHPTATASAAASRRHPPQRRDFRRTMGLVADGGLAATVRRTRPGGADRRRLGSGRGRLQRGGPAMKIAILAHNHHAIAQPFAGGLEAHTALVADELVGPRPRRHRVRQERQPHPGQTGPDRRAHVPVRCDARPCRPGPVGGDPRRGR